MPFWLGRHWLVGWITDPVGTWRNLRQWQRFNAYQASTRPPFDIREKAKMSYLMEIDPDEHDRYFDEVVAKYRWKALQQYHRKQENEHG